MNGLELLDLVAREVIRLIVRESVYVAPIFTVVAMTSYLLRQRGPGLHLALWSLVLLRLVLPPQLGNPVSAVRLLAGLRPAGVHIGFSVGPEDTSSGVVVPGAQGSRGNAAGSQTPWALIGVLVWGAGAACVGRRMWVARTRFRRLALAARPPRVSDLEDLKEAWRRRIGVRRRVRLAVTAEPVSPFTVGVVRPVIVLPEALVARHRACAAAIAHEMAHVRRLDALWTDLQRLLHCIYFFHPLVWYAGSRVDLERERSCDASVLSLGIIRPRSYAAALVDVAGLGLEVGSEAAFTRPPRRVHMRVRSIFLHRPCSITTRCAAAILVFVLGAFFIPLAGEAETAAPRATSDAAPPLSPAPPAPPAAEISPLQVAPAAAPRAVPAPPEVPAPAPVAMADPVSEARVTQGWGDFRNPFSGDVVSHRGFDLAAPLGTEVHAAADGEVSQVLVADEGRDTGRFVIVDHGNGLTTYYGHLDDVQVEVGEVVVAGQTIATVGVTGLTTGPHIHFEVRRDGERLDPGLFVGQ